MKKRILIIAVMALLVAATAFAADNSQSNYSMSDMYKYCQQAMQQGDAGQNMPMGRSDAGGLMNGPMMMRSEYK